MNLSEIKKLIAKSSNKDWYTSVDCTFHFPLIGLETNFKSFYSIYKFVKIQVEGWKKIDEEIPDVLKGINGAKFFYILIDKLDQLISSDEQLDVQWQSILKTVLNESNTTTTFDSSLTKFFTDTYKNNPKSFKGVMDYIYNSVNFRSASKDYFKGLFVAYEFSDKNIAFPIAGSTKNASSELSKLLSEIQNSKNEIDDELIKHYTHSETLLSDFAESIEELKTTKESNFNLFFENAKKQQQNLESSYDELLRLKKPAEYWSDRATKLKKEGWISVALLLILILFIGGSLYSLLWLTPEGMFLSFLDGDKGALKWSVIYVTFVSFMAFSVRALSKIIFSSFHLARDAEERESLTFVYLALIKDSGIEGNDRHLILQSLFSRAESGLLKDDSSPTMPVNIVEKYLKK